MSRPGLSEIDQSSNYHSLKSNASKRQNVSQEEISNIKKVRSQNYSPASSPKDLQKVLSQPHSPNRLKEKVSLLDLLNSNMIKERRLANDTLSTVSRNQAEQRHLEVLSPNQPTFLQESFKSEPGRRSYKPVTDESPLKNFITSLRQAS